jgi:plasmid stability protein
MATLTIRNLPEEVHDALRREAAEHRRSMEEEVRQTLTDRYRKKVPVEDLLKRLAELNARHPEPANAKMLMSEALIAGRRLEVLFEEKLISLEEKLDWESRIDARSVSLAEVETFFRKKWPWRPKTS